MWEYKTITAPKANFKKLDEELNVLGKEGWEAVGTVATKKGSSGVLLKRAISTSRRRSASAPRKQTRARQATKRPAARVRKATKRPAATARPKKQARTRKATKRPARGRGRA